MTLLRTEPTDSRTPRRRHLPLAPAPPVAHAGTARPPDDIQMVPWALLCPENTVLVEARDHRTRRATLSALGSGSRIGLVDDRPLSRGRLRRIARAAGLVVERELIILPTRNRPLAVVDDVESAVHHFWTNLAIVPPGLARTALPAALALHVVRALPWSWTGALAPGRVLLGRRP